MILLMHMALAQDPAGLWEQATNASAKADYPTATQSYEHLLEAGAVNESVYYNLGNSLYRQNKYAEAIVAWRRAASLAPRDPDIQANLAFARKKTRDDMELPTLVPWYAPQLSLLSHGESRYLGMLLLGAALLGWGLRRFFVDRLPPLELPLLVLGGTGIWLSAGTLENQSGCVVLAEEVKATSDLGGGVELFALHAGAEVMCLQESAGKTLLLLPDERRGWVRSEDVASTRPDQPFPKQVAKSP